jgi:type I restriction enzyme, R subunit
MGLTEADTCRKFIIPKLLAAGWDSDPHSIAEQRTFTDGRIFVVGSKTGRRKQKRADYLLRYTRDIALAVVEAKAEYKLPGDGIQQAKDYAETLNLKFAYSTNGSGIIEFDYLTGGEREVKTFPTPDELWLRLRAKSKLSKEATERLLTPGLHTPGKTPRYYQEVAINRAMEHILSGKQRTLLTLATGTGKTFIAFQICWRLWNSRWTRNGEYRRPRILYLSDRNILVDDPKVKDFKPFDKAAWKIENGVANKSREMYFAIYQALAKDEVRPGLYKEYPEDFFDLVIVDECHRGSARDDSNWREILDYFKPAYKLGMTATPLREDNRDTYLYFGNPIYTYSLKQGIDDGFLAPYRVHRILTSYDAAGWRPSKDQLDRYGRKIPDGEYQTKDFERTVAMLVRTQAIARNITDFLAASDRFAKTMVFCVDQEHAEIMRGELTRLNQDLVVRFPDYCCRVTADEGDIGMGHLSRFQDVETRSPVILTTSKLLTTGIDAPTCRNIVIARVVNSMVEFKQMIGRGTRVRDDYGKLYFSILDYTGSATRLFADPEFDGEPELLDEVAIDDNGIPITGTKKTPKPEPVLPPDDGLPQVVVITDGPAAPPRKYYVDGGTIQIAAQLVYELDADGKQLRVMELTDYTSEKVRKLFPNSAELRKRWADAGQRTEIILQLAERGISFDDLYSVTKQPDADPFDLLCNIAFNAPLRSRRERAERLRKEEKRFFEKYQPEARQILDELLEKYAEFGSAQFELPDILKVPPISGHGQVTEIAAKFGGPEKLREAVGELQALLYAA